MFQGRPQGHGCRGPQLLGRKVVLQNGKQRLGQGIVDHGVITGQFGGEHALGRIGAGLHENVEQQSGSVLRPLPRRYII